MAPTSDGPIYDQLIKNTDDVQKTSQEFDRKKLIEVLNKDIRDVEELLSKMGPGGDKRQHQVEILNELKALVKKFESGNGTFLDLYNDFYLFIERKLALDV